MPATIITTNIKAEIITSLPPSRVKRELYALVTNEAKTTSIS